MNLLNLLNNEYRLQKKESIATSDGIEWEDAIMFSVPTRFGNTFDWLYKEIGKKMAYYLTEVFYINWRHH